MTSNTRTPRARVLRWNVWWQWSGVSLVGVVVGALLLGLLDPILLPLGADEDFPLYHPWRLAVLNGVLYAPLSGFQWWILRPYLPRAWAWLIVPMGSVILLYPGAIWLLLAVGRDDAAWLIWFAGLGGSALYGIMQWLTPLAWIARNPRWWIWLAAAVPLGVIVVQISNVLAQHGLLRVTATNPGAMVATWGIYFVGMGLVLAWILQIPTTHPNRA